MSTRHVPPSRQGRTRSARDPCEEAATAVDELLVLSKDKSVNQIVVRGELAGVPSIRVSPMQSLRGEDESSGLTFAEGTDGSS